MESQKKKILILVPYYLPGHNAGGPIRSVSNIVYYLKDEFEFHIITKDRDFGDLDSYKNIKVNDWNKVKGADVFYLDPESKLKNMKKAINSIDYDLMYLNSFFSFQYTIYPLLLKKLKLIKNKPVIIAPRGEFSKGAIKIKKKKKRLYIKFAKLFKLYSDVLWQTSSSYESKDIRREFKKDVEVHEAINLPSVPKINNLKKSSKKSGEIKIIFLSRISSKKNLHGALKILDQLEGNIKFNIYGPVSDQKYWNKCKNIIAELSNNVNVEYRGSIEHEKVQNEMSKHDLFFFPTFGENYGHVIIESLMSGCPVLISNSTPWQDLQENNAGWNLSLEKENEFIDKIQKCINMNNEEINNLKKDTFKYGREIIEDNIAIKQNKELFNKALR
ncbi:glycosyltransferase family 4 protein [Halanaerobium saccharolyticum]|uniref:glycosyltransferase family 4 protein n=1 Tax=Halanaerobium saccharolyticum TaxID=43595 RepID=UPI003FCDE894